MKASLATTVVVLFLSVPWARSEASGQGERPAEVLAVRLSGRVDGRDFELLVSSKRTPPTPSCPKNIPGVDGYCPDRIVDGVSLWIEKRPVAVPSEAFQDLANPHVPGGVSLVADGGRLVIQIEGGDGTGSYEAKLHVTAHRVVRRDVYAIDHDGEWTPKTLEFRPK
jgi:hypothetical protein